MVFGWPPSFRNFWGLGQQVLQIMSAAALPAGSSQGGLNSVDHTGVVVGYDQLCPGEASSRQTAEEGEPPGSVFRSGQVDAEDLTVSLTVDTDSEETGMLTIRPPSRTFIVNASAQTWV